MTKREPKPKIDIQTRKAGPKGKGFANLRSPEQVESIPFEELLAPLRHDNLGGAKESSPAKIASPNLDAPKITSPDTAIPLAPTVPSLDIVTSPDKLTPLNSFPLIEQAEKLSYRKGHSRHNHDFWDLIISQLPGNEQNVYSWLYRFREGNSNITIILSLPTLAARCGVDERTAGRAMKRLADKGFVRDHSSHFGKGRAQGKRYWVYVPTALLGENLSPDKMTSLGNLPPIIDKDLKEQSKRESAPLDTKNCPECDGMGVRYIDPLDYSKGTVKCRHERLGK